MNQKLFIIVGFFFLICLVLILMSIGVIWAINTLFGLTIAFSVKTVLAMLILIIVFGRNAGNSKS